MAADAQIPFHRVPSAAIHLTLYNGRDYLPMVGLNLINVSNRIPWLNRLHKPSNVYLNM